MFKIVAVTVPRSLTAQSVPSANAVALLWTAAATGFVLQSSPAVGATASWSAVSGAPNPITGAGSFSVNVAGAQSQFYRLRK